MKKSGILNSQLSRIVASMGHTDKLVICDSGLPIPRGAEIVDLALTTNIPSFIDTLKIILEELEVQKIFIAEEMLSFNLNVYNNVMGLLDGVTIEKLPHEEFKELTRNMKNIAFVRTGEATPYANIILESGVTFD